MKIFEVAEYDAGYYKSITIYVVEANTKEEARKLISDGDKGDKMVRKFYENESQDVDYVVESHHE